MQAGGRPWRAEGLGAGQAWRGVAWGQAPGPGAGERAGSGTLGSPRLLSILW